MVMTLKPRDARHYAPKTTWSRSLTSSDEFTRRYCSHQCPARPQKQIAAYFWIFKSSTKFPFQRIKNQVNRRFLQAVMAKTLKVVHSENFWTARSAKSETGITPSFGLGLRWMTTRWKGNFINISIDLYLYMFYWVYRRDSMNKRQEQQDENKIEKMTMTTMKGSLGDAFIKRTW